MLYRIILLHCVPLEACAWYHCVAVVCMEINKRLIGIRIMQRRKALGLTQEELSEQIGLSKNHLSNIERGIYLPTTQAVMQICTALGETPDYYLIGKISTSKTSPLICVKLQNRLLRNFPKPFWTQNFILRLCVLRTILTTTGSTLAVVLSFLNNQISAFCVVSRLKYALQAAP